MPTQIDWKKESRSFNQVAEIYDNFRPGYPEALIEAVLDTSHAPPGGRILEIGSGTGKASLPFAQRGFSIHCVEQGAQLVQVAQRVLAGYSGISFEVCTFEEWQVQDGQFDLCISAQAFHWINKQLGYPKVRQALRPGGWLALIWNMYPFQGDEIGTKFQDAYRQYYPDYVEPKDNVQELIARRTADIEDSGCFGPVEFISMPWSERYDARSYTGLLNTYSDHLRMPVEKRQLLFDAIARVIDDSGGVYEKPYLATAYLARRLD